MLQKATGEEELYPTAEELWDIVEPTSRVLYRQGYGKQLAKRLAGVSDIIDIGFSVLAYGVRVYFVLAMRETSKQNANEPTRRASAPDRRDASQPASQPSGYVAPFGAYGAEPLESGTLGYAGIG